MQYIQVQDNHISFANMPIPEIAPDECLVKVEAIGVNRADILQRQGKYPAPAGESEVLGLEMSGYVEKIGSSVHNTSVGQRVFGLVAGGAYAQYVKVKADHLMALPEHYSFEQGAATAEVFLTAYQSLFQLGNLQPKQNVLIHAGASGVGTAAIQLAKAMGCFVATTVSSETKADACMALGADKRIIYKETDFYTYCKENKHVFDVIVDVVAGDYVNKNVALCKPDARIIILSMLGGRYAEKLDVARMLLNRVQLIASTLRNQCVAYKTNLIRGFVDHFGEKLEAGTIYPVIDSIMSWEEVDIAHLKMIDNKNIGKIILTTQS